MRAGTFAAATGVPSRLAPSLAEWVVQIHEIDDALDHLDAAIAPADWHWHHILARLEQWPATCSPWRSHHPLTAADPIPFRNHGDIAAHGSCPRADIGST